MWLLGKKGNFTIKSVYNALTCSSTGFYNRRIWKGKIPEKFKILWLMSTGAILTKDNLLKRKRQGDSSCVFCDEEETISHLFFQCPVARAIWLVVAKCFGASNIPMNLQQCWLWCEKWLPFGEKYHPWGFSAICWAIWKSRNRAVFDKKKTYQKSTRDCLSRMCTHDILVRTLCRTRSRSVGGRRQHNAKGRQGNPRCTNHKTGEPTAASRR